MRKSKPKVLLWLPSSRVSFVLLNQLLQIFELTYFSNQTEPNNMSDYAGVIYCSDHAAISHKQEHAILAPAYESIETISGACSANFVAQVMLSHAWRETIVPGQVASLMAFQANAKYFLLALSHRGYRKLGQIAASATNDNFRQVCEDYCQVLTIELKQQLSVGKHVNSLQHMSGYFKKDRDPIKTHSIKHMIDRYQQGKVSLDQAARLMRSYAHQENKEYLQRQIYWDIAESIAVANRIPQL